MGYKTIEEREAELERETRYAFFYIKSQREKLQDEIRDLVSQIHHLQCLLAARQKEERALARAERLRAMGLPVPPPRVKRVPGLKPASATARPKGRYIIPRWMRDAIRVR